LIFSLQPQISESQLIDKLKQKNILISSMGQGKLRIVTHLDYREVMHTYVIEMLEKLAL
jgi:threonine aldolase